MTAGFNKALFLDRDAMINVERGYVHRRESFEFIIEIFELCRAAQSLGHLVVVATNQAGIARGYYSESDFHDLTDTMIAQFATQQVSITRVYYCPSHPTFGVDQYKYESPDRKPNPGMLFRATADLDLDLASTMLIGDKPSDIEAGCAAGDWYTGFCCRPNLSEANRKRHPATYSLPSMASDSVFSRDYRFVQPCDATRLPNPL